MTLRVTDILQTALEEIRVYAPGETVGAADFDRALEQLNSMLEVWSLETITCYAIKGQAISLVVAKQTYTMGSGGDVNDTRPIRLIEGPGAAYVLDVNNQKYGVEVVTRERWNLIGDITATSNVPGTVFYDPQMPLGVLNVYPVPNAGGYTLYVDSFLQLGSFSTIGDTVSFPPGYRGAIQSNLAVWLGPFFKNAQVPADVKLKARYTKRALQRANRRTPSMIYDAYIVSRPSATYDIYSDTLSRGM